MHQELKERKWDVFICHASEDKEDFVRPLAHFLSDRGLSVWFDEMSLQLGDNLRRSIDRGLSTSRFGVVVLSKAFFVKGWTQYELDGLVQRESEGSKVILPVWHCVTRKDVACYSLSLAGRVAVESKMGLDFVAAAILNVAKPIISGVSLPNSPSPQIGRLDLLRDQPKTPKPHSQS